MKIEKNKEMNDFFLEARANLLNNLQKDSLINVNNDKEKFKLLKKMQEYDNSIKEIYLDKNLILNNPYYKNIKFNDTLNGKFKLKVETIPKNYAMNISWLLPDKNKKMKDYLQMGYFDTDIKIPTLKQNDDLEDNIVWMSPTLSEQNTINPFVENNARGNVLTFGLGIGYFPYMASLKENVNSITIIELNQEVIDMFNEIILPQFNTDKDIKIIKGDAFDYFNKPFLDKFDYIFVDIWQDSDDGFKIIEKLLELENYEGNINYWVEFSCYKEFRMLMFLYFVNLANGTIQQLLCNFKDEDKDMLTKIHRYFREKKHTVIDVNELKNYLYDMKIIREILSRKL